MQVVSQGYIGPPNMFSLKFLKLSAWFDAARLKQNFQIDASNMCLMHYSFLKFTSDVLIEIQFIRLKRLLRGEVRWRLRSAYISESDTDLNDSYFVVNNNAKKKYLHKITVVWYLYDERHTLSSDHLTRVRDNW